MNQCSFLEEKSSEDYLKYFGQHKHLGKGQNISIVWISFFHDESQILDNHDLN